MAKQIESLCRGFKVLDALMSAPIAFSLARLYQISAIPKPSLLGILETLKKQGIVETSAHGWRLTDEWLLQVQTYTVSRLQMRTIIRRPCYNGQTKENA